MSRPKAAVKDIDIDIADRYRRCFGSEIDIGDGDIDPPLAWTLSLRNFL